MIAFPNAKINLGLNILKKRTDGYHDIESCLYPIPWKDVLEIVPAKQFEFTQTGLTVPGDATDNLCVKAYQLIKSKYKIPAVKIHLHKVIPMGAGLGGGSADGAFTLKLLNALFQLEIEEQELNKLASNLGSDCPFFIRNKPALATGTGTTLSPLPISLSKQFIAIKHPGIHVSTQEAYQAVNPSIPNIPITEILDKDDSHWKTLLINDFEASVFPNHPAISDLKSLLYQQGAYFSAMSGSGSAVFGLFHEEPKLDGFEIFSLN